jgi:FkbM family methyltransferase
MSEHEAALPDYEARLELFYRNFLKPGQACLDVGAHQGRHLYPMLECIGNEGRAIAFEPIPDLAHNLAAEITARQLDGKVSVYPMALASQAGRSSFVIAVDAPGYSGMRERTYDVATSTRTIEVEVSTLDTMVDRSLERVDYIKIDAEGAEWEILKGARRTLERFRPIVSFEFGQASYGAYGVVPEEVFDFLDELRYLVFDIMGRRLSKAEFAVSSVEQKLWDYIAIPDEQDGDALVNVLRTDA